MKATITQSNFKGDVGAMQLDLQLDSTKLKCACSNITDICDVTQTIANLRKIAHNRVDTLIDIATADFMKGKLKNIY